LDLRGVKCPTNYVKTRLLLEEMAQGQVLEVLLDDGEPILNVPRSAKEDGNKILEVKKLEEGGYLCRILKG
jgi:TusA-related sulfurtransferase